MRFRSGRRNLSMAAGFYYFLNIDFVQFKNIMLSTNCPFIQSDLTPLSGTLLINTHTFSSYSFHVRPQCKLRSSPLLHQSSKQTSMPKSRVRRNSLNSHDQPSSITGTAATNLVSQISPSINDDLQRDGVVPEGATRFKRNMILLAHCRDACALDVGNADGYDVQSRPLMAIREWTKNGRGAEMIIALDFDINSSVITSLFGYLRVCKRFCGNEDGIAVGQNESRVWDTFKATNVEYAAISCRFMSKSPGKSNELFNTIVPTTLHLICFFSALQILSRRAERYQSDRKRERSKRTRKRSSGKPPYKKLRSQSQRVASAIQSIVLRWDTLLEAIGFVNCEEVPLPYLQFNLEMV